MLINSSKNETSKHFSEQDIEDFRQCFKLYAPEGFVTSPEKLGFIMRSLNIKPTIVELKSYFKQHKRDDGIVDFAEFLSILHTHLKTEEANKEILEAFRIYDTKKTGFISAKDLKMILTMTGERLSNKDVDMILRESNATKDGRVNYENLVKVLSTPISQH